MYSAKFLPVLPNHCMLLTNWTDATNYLNKSVFNGSSFGLSSLNRGIQDLNPGQQSVALVASSIGILSRMAVILALVRQPRPTVYPAECMRDK